MGNDGGSITTRRDLVKAKEPDRKVDETEIKSSRAKLCALTKKPFSPPLVVDRLGLVYNKFELLSQLADKKMPPNFCHITSLKDVKTVKTDLNKVNDTVVIVCPVSLVEFGGSNQFAFNWKCGCLVAMKAVERMEKDKTCINCGEKYEDDLIKLVQTNDERSKMYNDILDEKLKGKVLLGKKKLREENKMDSVSDLTGQEGSTKNLLRFNFGC